MAPLPRAENEFSASFPRKKGGNAAENIFLKKKIDFPLAQLVKVYCIAPEVKFRSKRLRKRAFFFTPPLTYFSFSQFPHWLSHEHHQTHNFDQCHCQYIFIGNFFENQRGGGLSFFWHCDCDHLPAMGGCLQAETVETTQWNGGEKLNK